MLIKELILVVGLAVLSHGYTSPYAWSCDENRKACAREIANETITMDLMECKMTCADEGLLWPLPTISHSVSKTLDIFPDETYVSLDAIDATPTVALLLNEFMDDVFIGYLTSMKANAHKSSQVDPRYVKIDVTVDDEFTDLTLATDESYNLTVMRESATITRVVINAVTYQGARHGLETLSQLITWNRMQQGFLIHSSASIVDSPFYKYRGIMVDTSRNFMPVPVLKRIIDGISYNKLNVFHWHISDSQSFPLCVPSGNIVQKLKLNSFIQGWLLVPHLCDYGAYSEEETYSYEDAVEIINYALVRGVIVLPEVDIPMHAANGWQFGPR